jgi:hypothetical protein
MELRDHFAGLAMQAMLANSDADRAIQAVSEKKGESPYKMTAMMAYAYANAMLQMRQDYAFVDTKRD